MTLHDQLMRLYAKRGEVTLVLEQLDVDIVRTRAMFDLEAAINARTVPPAPGSNAGAGEETSAGLSLASKTRDPRAGAPTDAGEGSSLTPVENPDVARDPV